MILDSSLLFWATLYIFVTLNLQEIIAFGYFSVFQSCNVNFIVLFRSFCILCYCLSVRPPVICHILTVLPSWRIKAIYCTYSLTNLPKWTTICIFIKSSGDVVIEWDVEKTFRMIGLGLFQALTYSRLNSSGFIINSRRSRSSQNVRSCSLPKFFIKHPNLNSDCGDIYTSDKFNFRTRRSIGKPIPFSKSAVQTGSTDADARPIANAIVFNNRIVPADPSERSVT